jgi:hypothetical protein
LAPPRFRATSMTGRDKTIIKKSTQRGAAKPPVAAKKGDNTADQLNIVA